MFIHKKKNRSGTTNVVVFDKYGGDYREIHNIGVGNEQTELGFFVWWVYVGLSLVVVIVIFLKFTNKN